MKAELKSGRTWQHLEGTKIWGTVTLIESFQLPSGKDEWFAVIEDATDKLPVAYFHVDEVTYDGVPWTKDSVLPLKESVNA